VLEACCGKSTKQAERFVVTPRGHTSKPLVGVRGFGQWNYSVTNLVPFAWYKVHISFSSNKVSRLDSPDKYM